MGLSHVTIFSEKMDESIKFYRDMFGMNILWDMRKEALNPVVFLQDKESDMCIEIVSKKEDSYSGNGIMIGFTVQDLEKEYDLFNEKGYAPSLIISPNPNAHFFTVKDPNGVEIQILHED